MTDNRALAIPERKSEGLLSQLVLAAKDPTFDADKVRALADLVNSQQDREMLLEFNRDLNAAIMEMPVISKDNEIIINDRNGNFLRKQGSFASFEDINRVVKPILQRHNLAMRFDIGENQQEVENEQGGTSTRTMVTVTPILSHANGHTERGGTMNLPADTSGGKNAVQAVGSASQYGKRYSMVAMLNIVLEGVDNDGSGARGGGVVKALPYEREQTVREEAKQAYGAGSYMEWFHRQSPKDRSFLASSGLHDQYGGDSNSLPPPKQVQATVIEEEERKPPPPKPEPEPQQQAQTGKRTPRQWVDGFKAEVDKITTLPDLDEFEERYRDTLAQLKAHDDKLWREADDHALARREAIENGRLV